MTDIKAVDLNLLKALDALLDEGSVTRAAQRLGLTQPAVSGMLTRLRDAFGDPLFVRAQRGLVPTRRAQELAVPVKQVLGEIETLLRPVEFDPLRAEMTFSIAATDYAQQAVVIPFLAALSRRAPGVRVLVRAVEGDGIAVLLERGEVDLALLVPETTPPDMYMRPLFDETYVCAMRADHPDATAQGLDLDRFCALRHALVSHAGDPFHGVTDTALAQVGRKRHVSVSVSSFLLLVQTLRRTDLITVAPKRLMCAADGLRISPPPVPVPGFTKVAVWHGRTQRSAGHRWLRALLFEVAAQDFG